MLLLLKNAFLCVTKGTMVEFEGQT